MKTKIILYLLSFISVFSLSGCLYALSPTGWCSDWEIYFDGKETQNKSKTFTMEVCSNELGYSLNDPLLRFKINKNRTIAHQRLTALLHSVKILENCLIDKSTIQELYAGGHPITSTITCPNPIIFNQKFGPTYRTNKNYPIYMYMSSFPFPK